MKKQTNRALQAAETKTKLIDAALAVFSRKGFSASTTKDIARQAGVTDGLIYHYFTSKEELLWAVIDRHTLNESLRLITLEIREETGLEEAFTYILRSLFRLLDEKEALIAMFFGESHRNPAIQEKLNQLVARGVQLFAGFLKERSTIGEHELYIAIRNMLNALVMYFLIHDRVQDNKNERENYITVTVHQFIKIIS